MSYLLLASIVLAIITVWTRGGKLGRLGAVTFRGWWLIPLTAIAQLLALRFWHSPSRLSLWHPRPLIMIGSYLILWTVAFWNRHLPWMWLILIGITLNFIAIALNGGYMPIAPTALARIGAGQAAYQMPSESVVLGSKDVLLPAQEAYFWVLGDTLVIPKPFPWPTAMSVGDVALAVGVFLFIVQTARPEARAVSQSS